MKGILWVCQLKTSGKSKEGVTTDAPVISVLKSLAADSGEHDRKRVQ